MAKTLSEIKTEWRENEKKILALAQNGGINLDTLRKDIRQKMLKGEEIKDANNQAVLPESLEGLLIEEYKLEQEEMRLSFRADMIAQGKDPKSPRFKYELDILVTRNELENNFTREQIDEQRKLVRRNVALGVLIPGDNALGQLLLREVQNERSLKRIELEENFLSLGYKKGSPLFEKEVALRMLRNDMGILSGPEYTNHLKEYREKKGRGEVIDLGNSYFVMFEKEARLEAEIDSIVKEEEQKKLQERLRQEELNKKTAEASAKTLENLVENLDQNKSKGFFGWMKRVGNIFRRTPKSLKQEAPMMEMPVIETPVTETPATETTDKEDGDKKIDQEILDQWTKEEKERKEKLEREEEERRNRYRIEFATKELTQEIKNCRDPKRLSEYLEKATKLSPDAQEHLKARILANATIDSLENSRAIIQKNRPPAVKYKDGTILLKNKMKDVPKQTSMNGCWSAVLSDMLGHFGVDLSQEMIRAYRPDLNNDPAQKKDGVELMDRLNRDTLNEINDMADLIQRTVPNVAHHHMSLGAGREENKAVLRETVADALLNKNSPVAVLYGDHYLSIVGIKGDTLIVQNSSANYTSKYQKLSIDDLFEGCKGKAAKGQVTIDWLEDLKFNKNGTCKNITEQWKNMGISCDKRVFKPGKEKNYISHVRGNEYYDTSRLKEGIEETIYLPKMSFVKEKDMIAAEIKMKQMQDVKEGKMTMEDVMQHDKNMVKDEGDITVDEINLEELANEK